MGVQICGGSTPLMDFGLGERFEELRAFRVRYRHAAFRRIGIECRLGWLGVPAALPKKETHPLPGTGSETRTAWFRMGPQMTRRPIFEAKCYTCFATPKAVFWRFSRFSGMKFQNAKAADFRVKMGFRVNRWIWVTNAPGRFRRPMLYPVELRARASGL